MRWSVMPVLSVLALTAAVVPVVAQQQQAVRDSETTAAATSTPVPDDADRVASALGRVEPRSGEIRVGALMLGRITEVLVKVNDRVGAGDLLIRLDDDEAAARLTTAETDVASKKRERDDVSASGEAADRRRVEDAVATAERGLATARRDIDRLSSAYKAGRAAEADLVKARAGLKSAQERLDQRRAELARYKANNTKAPARIDSALIAARSELAAAEALFEKTRIRAPISGTILQLPVRVGETVAPSPERPLVVLADLSELHVRADVEERNAANIFAGQQVTIKSEAFSGTQFSGRVTSIAPLLGPGRTVSPNHIRPNEGRFVDVTVELTKASPLISGMQVDVFFLGRAP